MNKKLRVQILMTLMILLLPSLASAQGTVTASSVLGQVEWKAVAAANFSPLQQQSTQVVHVGDQVRTGPDAQLVLTLPDGSYMVVSQNSTLTIQDYWGSNIRNIVNVMMGKVRFYIQHFGGTPNPYQVQTPSALIAVRGTVFDVIVSDSKSTEVACLQGRVSVQGAGKPDREVILDEGLHTLVPMGGYPIMPVAANEALVKSRIVPVIRQDDSKAVLSGKNSKSDDRLLRDNDRMNQISDPQQAPHSVNGSADTQRAKPTLQYPPNHS
jgi:hypothetical protein